MASANEALAAWRQVLGHARVLEDAATLSRFAASTSSWSTRPLAVLQPRNTAEVAQVARIATRWHAPVYPVSTGRNWGYGDACAVTDGHAIIDLSGMNRILEADATLAYAVIEPGVTQQQLSEFLRDRQLPLWMDCTGAGPDTSLVGNILERGFGHSPYGNRFQNVAGMELVLADGDVVRTGFGHYPAALNHRVYQYGVGPYVDGLFTQSNMGIVTSLGLWLMPQTQALNHFLCRVEEHNDIAHVVDALRPLRLDGTLRSILHIGNDLRVISGGTTYPRELAGGVVPLPDEVRRQLRSAAGVGAWTVSGALYGSHAQVAAARSALRHALAATRAKPRFLDERKLALGATAARLLRGTAAGQRLAAQVALGRSLFEMNRGIPNGRFLAGAYWRRRGGLPAGFPANANPALDHCGMQWVSPVLPMRGADLLHVHALAEPIFRAHRFDLFATFSMVSERALGGVLTIAYDQEDPAEVARARSCYHEVFGTMMREGYIPYRVGLQSMADLDDGNDGYWRMIRRIKAALDPAQVIAPGRYAGRDDGNERAP